MASRKSQAKSIRLVRRRQRAGKAAARSRRSIGRRKLGREGRIASRSVRRRRGEGRRRPSMIVRRGIPAAALRQAQRAAKAGDAGHTGGGSPAAAAADPAVDISPPLLPPPGQVEPEPAEAERIRAAAYAEGYREGVFDGGEAKLGRLIPRYTLLPELQVDDVIAAGFRAVAGWLHPLLTPADVFAAADGALREGRPLSVVRLGDGELLTLAHGTVISAEEALRWGPFLPYAGIRLPDPAAREALAAAVRTADIVGVPESRHPSYQGLLFPVLRHYGIDYRALRLTTSTVNYELNAGGYLARLLHGRRVLLIGNQAEALAGFLGQRGVSVGGWLAPVQGVADVTTIVARAREIPGFDLALVAAGVAAVMICAQLAGEQGKVALDLGHLADKLIQGEAALPQVGEG